MKNILVYSDSLTWGIIPNTRQRLPFDVRWPGVMENALNAAGVQVRVLENCLNGRRTVWDDPFKPGRNGAHGLAQVIEMHSPLDLVILMLGTNDFQFCHPHNDAWSAAQGIATLVAEIRRAPVEPGMPIPQVLVIAPSVIGTPAGLIAKKFAGAERRSVGVAETYRELCSSIGCAFFDAGSAVSSSSIDGIHLDREQHQTLGEALAVIVGVLIKTDQREVTAP
jgi:lysophospholipase L1-like esterase